MEFSSKQFQILVIFSREIDKGNNVFYQTAKNKIFLEKTWRGSAALLFEDFPLTDKFKKRKPILGIDSSNTLSTNIHLTFGIGPQLVSQFSAKCYSYELLHKWWKFSVLTLFQTIFWDISTDNKLTNTI